MLGKIHMAMNRLGRIEYFVIGINLGLSIFAAMSVRNANAHGEAKKCIFMIDGMRTMVDGGAE